MTTLPFRLHRTLGDEKWRLAIMLFDGKNPLIVSTNISEPDIWTFYVELYNDKPSCVTRKNGVIVNISATSHFV